MAVFSSIDSHRVSLHMSPEVYILPLCIMEMNILTLTDINPILPNTYSSIWMELHSLKYASYKSLNLILKVIRSILGRHYHPLFTNF